MSFNLETTIGGRELEWPEEVIGLFEVGATGDDLVDEVFNAVHAGLVELTGNEGVVRKRHSLSVDLTISSLVDKFLDGGS